MSNNQINKRYVIDNFRGKSLEDNPLNSPVERDLRIYLPLGYFDSEDVRYPVIYFLHGYGGNNRNWTITSNFEEDRALPLDKIPKKFLDQIDLDRLPTYEKLDELITNGELAPFILIQPDGSLHVPHIKGVKNLRGLPATKGSYYLNSPFSGNYMDYIIQDVLEYVDSNYRTIPNKQHRALMGGSMGGAGTLRLSLFHPEKFNTAAALSPGNISYDLMDWELIVPLYKEIFGEKITKRLGASAWADILDTFDLVFSKDNPLLPSIKRDENGKIVGLNEEALKNWTKNDINNIIKENPDALKKLELLLNCESRDEFGLCSAVKEIHKTLEKFNIKHQFEIYTDPKASLTPHILGIGYNIIPAIRFCLQFLI